MTQYGDSAWDTLTAYAGVVRRRVWVIALVAIAIPLAVIGLSRLEDPVYEASAEVLVSRENLAATLVNVPDTLVGSDPVRFMQTQARLARTAEVVKKTLNAANPSFMSPGEFLGSSGVRAETDSDLLVFSAQSPVSQEAVVLANAYARSYVRYRNALDTAPHRRALDAVGDRVNDLRRAGDTDSALYATLVESQQQLQTIVALKTDSATLVQPADEATQISPQTAKRAQLALVFGLFAGLGIAFLLEASDRRLRSPRDIPQRLKLPILGRIPRSVTMERLPAITLPGGLEAEAYRILRMNIERANEDRDVRSMMLTSAVAGEGKSTTAANLAVTLARAGRNVILVDADFLRPSQAGYFSIAARPGLVQVVTREVEPAEALVRIGPPFGMTEGRRGRLLGTESFECAGIDAATHTHVSGRSPADAAAPERDRARLGERRLARAGDGARTTRLHRGDGGTELRELLAQLEADADLVIVDAPPLGTSVTLGLASLVDGVLVVANAEMLREAEARRARRIPRRAPRREARARAHGRREDPWSGVRLCASERAGAARSASSPPPATRPSSAAYARVAGVRTDGAARGGLLPG